jgi:CheY-like chemotaxis protein
MDDRAGAGDLKKSMAQLCVIGETDSFIARLLRRFAEESGLQAVQVRFGQDVLAMARQTKPAVIILEAELPGRLRGWEAAQALKADPELRSIPVITCSWLNEAEVRMLVEDTVGHLQKPDLHYADFVAALRAAGLERGRQFA